MKNNKSNDSITCCLDENTKVLEANGMKSQIKNLKIGSRITTPDGGSAMVTNTWKGRENDLLELNFEDATIKLTPNHPVQTPNGFVKAGDLKAGDEVSIFNYSENSKKTVKSVNKVEHQMFSRTYIDDGQLSVYNIDTEGRKPFIIDGGVIVGTFYTQQTI
ncbi:MAG: hypothetical protein LBC71_02815 [Oscillospiraceae bacterium]|jgi:intein/homing endonuclease|nr:hypothetical protein [Oscillospiraceae bacterium]